MKKSFVKYILVFLVGLLHTACSHKTVTEPAAYFSYLENPENGLIKEKSVAGVKMKVKYVSGEYMAYTALNRTQENLALKDSVLRSYDNSVTFILNIGPDKNEAFDITRVDVNSYGEFAERIENMAFRAQDWIKVKVKNKEYTPAIVRMENVNALGPDRNFIVVFSSEKGTEKDLRSEDMCFIYDDELFSTGTNKFVFEAEDIQDIPSFKF